MSARTAILAAIRNADVPVAAAATVPSTERATEEDLLARFLRVLAEVGGHGVVLMPGGSLDAAVAELNRAGQATQTVLRGRFAVAENGAVYVDAADLEDRAAVVGAEHLVVALRRGAIVATMHEAVRQMPAESQCGWFLSGPSKTADIEQALVVGAQGARVMHVLLEP